MKANEAPEKIYIACDVVTEEGRAFILEHPDSCLRSVEYTRTDAFIKKACEWIKGNITNNPNANSVLVRNGCVTLDILVDDFKKYMKGE